MENKLIGKDAKRIWRLLARQGRMTVRKITESTDFPELYVFLTLGWLSRDNKVQCIEIGNELYVELTSAYLY